MFAPGRPMMRVKSVKRAVRQRGSRLWMQLAHLLNCPADPEAVDRALSRLGIKRLLAALRHGVFPPMAAGYVRAFGEDCAKVSVVRAAWVTAFATLAAAVFTVSNLKLAVTVVVVLL
jgi:hypothetical protein